MSVIQDSSSTVHSPLSNNQTSEEPEQISNLFPKCTPTNTPSASKANKTLLADVTVASEKKTKKKKVVKKVKKGTKKTKKVAAGGEVLVDNIIDLNTVSEPCDVSAVSQTVFRHDMNRVLSPTTGSKSKPMKSSYPPQSEQHRVFAGRIVETRVGGAPVQGNGVDGSEGGRRNQVANASAPESLVASEQEWKSQQGQQSLRDSKIEIAGKSLNNYRESLIEHRIRIIWAPIIWKLISESFKCFSLRYFSSFLLLPHSFGPPKCALKLSGESITLISSWQ